MASLFFGDVFNESLGLVARCMAESVCERERV